MFSVNSSTLNGLLRNLTKLHQLRYKSAFAEQLLIKRRPLQRRQQQQLQQKQQCRAYMTICPRLNVNNKTRLCLVLLPLTNVACTDHAKSTANTKMTHSDVSNY